MTGLPDTGLTMDTMINDAGIKLIKEFEGCALVAYQNNGDVPTIGYGCTHGVTLGMTLANEQQASDRLQQCCLPKIEGPVRNMVRVQLTDDQFSALVSFAFNEGTGRLQESTLLSVINAGDLGGVREDFMMWVKIGGSISAGLQRRRSAEADLFLAK